MQRKKNRQDADTADEASRERLRLAVFEVLDNQLRDGDPPETRATLDRLTAEGHDVEDARRLIAALLAIEMFEIIRGEAPFDLQRYLDRMAQLPELPGD